MPDYFQSESDATLRRVFFTAVKTDDVNDRLIAAEMSTFTLKLTKPSAPTAPATPSGTTVAEVSSALCPGLWYVQLNAADLDEPGKSVLVITNSAGSKVMRPREILLDVKAASPYVATPAVNVTKWSGTTVATPTTAGVPRVDVKACETGVITATAIAADAITAAKIADGAIDLATFAADALLGAFGILDAGTAQAGGATTITLRASASSLNDAYVGAAIYLKGGTGALQVNQITDYNGTTKVATVANAWATNPDVTSTYAVKAASAPGSAPSAGTVATAVWDEILENGIEAAGLVRLIVSACVAMVSGFSTGTLVFRDLANSKNRFVAIDDEDVGRTSVAILDTDP